jgi:hypothetical protein
MRAICRPTGHYMAMGDDTERRLAQNQHAFRTINNRLSEGHARFALDDAEYTCECADLACIERVHLTSAEYQRVRSNPRRFVVAPGHAFPEVEVVIERHPGWDVVEKVGVGGEVAEHVDPLSAPG